MHDPIAKAASYLAGQSPDARQHMAFIRVPRPVALDWRCDPRAMYTPPPVDNISIKDLAYHLALRMESLKKRNLELRDVMDDAADTIALLLQEIQTYGDTNRKREWAHEGLIQAAQRQRITLKQETSHA